MYHYEYVSKSNAAPYKAELIEIINKVQDESGIISLFNSLSSAVRAAI